jgi:hypothetical protein
MAPTEFRPGRYLQQAFEAGDLQFAGVMEALADPIHWKASLATVRSTE